MSKVFIDRKLLERLQERLDPHRDAVDWGMVCDAFRAQSAEPVQGEAVDVVAWANPSDLVDDGYGHSFVVSSSEYHGRVPIMTVAQHDRIMAAAKPDAELVADAARWNYYAPKVAGQCGVTLQEMNATIDAELAELQSAPPRT